MSLDNTSHPSIKHCADTVNARYIHGRPESELVPSRYALRVGEILDLHEPARSGRPGVLRGVALERGRVRDAPIDRGAEIRCYMRDPDGYLIEVGQSTELLKGHLAKKRPEDLPG
jgi:hypothetical protein